MLIHFDAQQFGRFRQLPCYHINRRQDCKIRGHMAQHRHEQTLVFAADLSPQPAGKDKGQDRDQVHQRVYLAQKDQPMISSVDHVADGKALGVASEIRPPEIFFDEWIGQGEVCNKSRPGGGVQTKGLEL